MLTAPVNKIAAAGAAIGLRANRLAGLLNLPAGDRAASLGSEWGEIIPAVLNPENLTAITTIINDTPAFYTVATKGEISVLCGVTGDIFNAESMSPPEIAVEFTRALGEPPDDMPYLSQNFGPNALITMFCAADHIKRAKFESMLNPSLNSFAVSEELLAARFSDISKKQDIRWLSVLASQLRINEKPDFPAGVRELISTSALKRNGKLLEPTETGAMFFGELSEAKAVVGMSVMYFEGGNLRCLSVIFTRTPNFVWYADLSEKGVIASVSREQVRHIMAGALYMGEDVPEAAEIPAKISPDVAPSVKASGGQVCPKCGVPGAGKFCKNCGAKFPDIAASETRADDFIICPGCNNIVPSGAKFCKNCGGRITP